MTLELLGYTGAALLGTAGGFLFRAKPGKKKTSRKKDSRKTDYGASRTSGTVQQGTGNTVNHYNHTSNELLYYSQAIELQKTVDWLKSQLEFKNKMIDNYHAQFVKQEQETELWKNEYLSLRDDLEQAKRIPLLDMDRLAEGIKEGKQEES